MPYIVVTIIMPMSIVLSLVTAGAHNALLVTVTLVPITLKCVKRLTGAFGASTGLCAHAGLMHVSNILYTVRNRN